jgi:hypothetical protein
MEMCNRRCGPDDSLSRAYRIAVRKTKAQES